MILDRWNELASRLEAALDSPDPQRYVFDSGDPDLTQLFQWHLRVGSFLSGDPERPGETDPTISRVIAGRYRLEAVLGRGGAGVVYRASDERVPGRRVAIKLLHDFWSSEDWMRRRFLEEAQLLARLDHPGIVSLTDAGETGEGRLFIAMPYHQGRSLRDALKSAPLEPAFCARVLHESGEAAGYAHREGILHRDLKPENILLVRREDREHALLIDFGIAQTGDPAAGLKTTTHLMGSAAYMAPEHLLGKAVRESDIYSLAVLAWEMLTGRLPFDSVSPFALPGLQKEGVGDSFFRLRPDLGVRIGRLLSRALDFDPARRPSAVTAFTGELAELLTAQEVDSRLARLWVMRRSRRWILGGAAASVAAAGAGGWWLRDRLRPLTPEERVIDFPKGYQAEMAGFTTHLDVTERAIRDFPGGGISAMRYLSRDQGQLHKMLSINQKQRAFRHGWKLALRFRAESGYAAAGISVGHFAPRFDAGFQIAAGKVELIATRQVRAGWDGIRAAVSFPPSPALTRMEMHYDPVRASATVSLDGDVVIRDYTGHLEYRDEMGVFFAIGSTDGSMASSIFGGLRFEILG